MSIREAARHGIRSTQTTSAGSDPFGIVQQMGQPVHLRRFSAESTHLPSEHKIYEHGIRFLKDDDEESPRIPRTSIILATAKRYSSARLVVMNDARGRKGRGAYLCRRQACLDRALQRRAFQRAFRATLLVDEDEIAAALRTIEAVM